MKPQKKSAALLAAVICLIGLQGCALLEFLPEESALGRAAITAEGGGIAAEEAALSSEYRIPISSLWGGSFAVASEEAASALYEDLSIRKYPGRSTQVFVKGRTSPVGEVFEGEGKIKFRNGTVWKADESIFTVRGEAVYVRYSPSASAEVKAVLRKGQFVVKLGEISDGWYQVEIIKDGVRANGYVLSSFIIPLIPIKDKTSSDYPFSDLKTNAIRTITLERVKKDLLGRTICGYQFNSFGGVQKMIIEDPFLNGDESFYLNLSIQTEPGNGWHYSISALLRYTRGSTGWKLYNISNESCDKTYIQPPAEAVPDEHQFERGTNYAGKTPSGKGNLSIRLQSRQPISISLDGHDYKTWDVTRTIHNVPAGSHHLEVFIKNDMGELECVYNGKVLVAAGNSYSFIVDNTYLRLE